jgi:hypothetical protein
MNKNFMSINVKPKVRGYISKNSLRGTFRAGLFILSLLICIDFSLAAQDLPSRRIEDDSSLRISLQDSWFKEAPGTVLNKRAENYTLRGGSRIQVRAEAGGNEFLIVLARELEGPSRVIVGQSFPGWAQGSWVLTRSTADGSPTRIRVFLRSDPYTYIQFRPFSADRAQMDVVLYDAYVVRSLPLAIPFERLFVLPLEEALAMAGDRFPLKYFDPEPNMYRDQRAFISSVRALLPGLRFVDDGAIDERGNYVFINTLESQSPASPGLIGGLNCSGFAKWIVDGLLKPYTGERLPIAPLKEPFGTRGSSFTEHWESLRDPFFGLDWIRNLASQAGTILRSPSFAALGEFEVRTSPFSQLILRQGNTSSLRSYPGFLPEAGYGVEGLQPLLYTLAIDEPGRIYLAAVNTEIGAPVTSQNLRGIPRLRQYFHVAVLVPYFNEFGNFQIAVFESAEETSFTAFRNRYPGHFVNLARIPVEGQFNPN